MSTTALHVRNYSAPTALVKTVICNLVKSYLSIDLLIILYLLLNVGAIISPHVMSQENDISVFVARSIKKEIRFIPTRLASAKLPSVPLEQLYIGQNRISFVNRNSKLVLSGNPCDRRILFSAGASVASRPWEFQPGTSDDGNR